MPPAAKKLSLRWRGKDEQPQKGTGWHLGWHRVVVWNGLVAGYAADKLEEGRPPLCRGNGREQRLRQGNRQKGKTKPRCKSPSDRSWRFRFVSLTARKRSRQRARRRLGRRPATTPSGGRPFISQLGHVADGPHDSHLSRSASRRSDFLSPTIRIVTPVTLPTISACDG